MRAASAGRLRAAFAGDIANEMTGCGMNAASGLNDDGYEVLHTIVVALVSFVVHFVRSFGCGSRVEVGFQVSNSYKLSSP